VRKNYARVKNFLEAAFTIEEKSAGVRSIILKNNGVDDYLLSLASPLKSVVNAARE